MSNFILRPYQQQCLDSIVENAKKGVLRQVAVLATGLGKTVIFGHLPSKVKEKGKKTLILAHREELLDQAKDKLEKIDPTLKIEVEQGDRSVESDVDVVVASVPTIGRANSTRIEKFNPKEYGLIIVDECVAGNTKIRCKEGEIKIKEIVEKKLGVSVLTQTENGRHVYKKVTDWFSSTPKHRQYRVAFSQFSKSLEVTGNHKIDRAFPLTYGKKKLVYKAEGLKKGMYVFRNLGREKRFSFAPIISKKQEEILIGLLLGDGNLALNGSNNKLGRFRFICKNTKKTYFKYVYGCLDNLCNGITTECASGFCNSMMSRFQTLSSYEFGELYHQFYLPSGRRRLLGNNKKSPVYSPLFFGITDVSLAFWIMSDGSIHFRENGKGAYCIHTQSYSYVDHVLLRNILKEKFGLSAVISVEKKRDGRRFYFLRLNDNDSKKLSKMISKYVPDDMQYKLWEEHRGKFVGVEGVEKYSFGIDTVSEVSLIDIPKTYNIAVEETHKYFANDILVHNCHHATADTYKRVFEYFDVLKGSVKEPNGRVLLGVTATPNRADHVGLDTIFDQIVFSYTLRDGIEKGYLSDIEAYTVNTKTDISQVHTRMGDFAEGELAETINNDERNQLIVESYQEMVPSSKALVFAANVEHAEDLTRWFRSGGIEAEYVVGATDKDKRRRIIDDFQEGKLKVLVNVGVFTEGFDCPSIQTIMMARPTKSSVLFSQILGRGTRLHPDKDCLKLIDFVDNTGKHKVVSLPSLFGAPSLKGTNGKKIIQIVELIEKIQEVNPDYPVEHIEDWSDENIDKIIKKVDIFSQAQIPETVKQYSRFSWEKLGEDEYRLQFPEVEGMGWKDELVIAPNMLNQYEVQKVLWIQVTPSVDNGYRKWHKEKEETLFKAKKLPDAFAWGDNWVNNNKPDSIAMFSQDSSWRQKKPTDKQINLLRKFGIPTPAGLTKGQASILIAKELNNRSRY